MAVNTNGNWEDQYRAAMTDDGIKVVLGGAGGATPDVNISKVGGVAVGANGLPVTLTTAIKGEDATRDALRVEAYNLEAVGSSGVVNTNLIESTDVSWFPHLAIQLSGTWVGNVTFQGSNNNTNFIDIPFKDLQLQSISPTQATNGLFVAPREYRYLRVRMTAYTSGTATATLMQSSMSANTIVGDPDFGRAVDFTGVSRIVKASPGVIRTFDFSSVDLTLVYLQIHNRSVLPVLNDVPLYEFAIGAGTATTPTRLAKGAEFFGANGKRFPTGISWGVSTTPGTYTAAVTAANYKMNLHYL